MLTPRFSLSQDAQFIYIKMHVPHLKLNETEIHIDEDEVYFHSRPYFLRLHLSGNVVENDKSKSSYDVESGWLSMTLPKQNNGEHFENLEMLTKLLTPKCSSTTTTLSKTNVEVLKSDSNGGQDVTTINEKSKDEPSNDDENDNDAHDIDWFIEQTLYTESESLLSQNVYYGFANQKTSPLDPLSSELLGMIDLLNPDSVPRKQRTILRREQEHKKFDCEHYLADFFDDEQILDIISVDFKELTGVSGTSTVLSDEEQEQLLKLPRKEYIIDDSEILSVYLGLVDLLFAYAFDYRQTGGEHSVESDWNICKLSSSLSWLDSFTNLREVIVSCCRRCLCFPLYRHWKVFERVVSDVQLIFQVGQTQILKCLLNMLSIVRKSETHYPLADIFLTDYCVWIQSACPKRLQSMSNALSQINISKEDIGFSLNDMESDAAKLMENESDEDTDVDQLASAISNTVSITSGVADSDDDSSSDESEDDSTDNSEDDSTDNSEDDSTDNSEEDSTGSEESSSTGVGDLSPINEDHKQNVL